MDPRTPPSSSEPPSGPHSRAAKSHAAPRPARAEDEKLSPPKGQMELVVADPGLVRQSREHDGQMEESCVKKRPRAAGGKSASR